MAEDKFNPNVRPELSLSLDRNQTGQTATTGRQARLSADATLKSPLGGELQIKLTGQERGESTVQALLDNLTGLETSQNTSSITSRQNIEINYKQPLLRGFGTQVNRASIRLARLDDQNNFLSLRSILINLITEVVQAYRQLIQMQEQLKIDQLSLEQSRRQLEFTEAFIEAGRLPKTDLVQSQTSVSQREVRLIVSQNSLESAQLKLLQVLDIDQQVIPVATEMPAILEPPLLNPDILIQTALENNSTYLQSLINLEKRKLDLIVARDEQKWNLDLDTSYTNNLINIGNDSEDLRASLTFSREFGDLVREQSVQRGQTSLQRTINLIDVLNFEDELVNAQNQELNAVIEYLNSLTLLEQTLGVTLDRWNVFLQKE